MNKTNIYQIFAVVFLAIVISACSSNEEYPTPVLVIEANAKYMNEENFEKAMNTIHKDSPSYPATESMMKQIYDRYDLNFKITNMKVIEENDTEAKVEFTQITTKISGPPFKNNKSTGIHTLKKDGDSWKIYTTQMTDLQYLD